MHYPFIVYISHYHLHTHTKTGGEQRKHIYWYSQAKLCATHPVLEQCLSSKGHWLVRQSFR